MDHGGAEWRAEARRALLRLRNGAAGWGYRAGGLPAVEPTVLACLGLLADRAPPGETSHPETVAASASASAPAAAEPEEAAPASAAASASAGWLARIQGPDGALGLSAAQPAPGWTTPLALLLWQAMGGHEPERRRAVAWLLRQEGQRMSPADDPGHIIGHDTMLAGWPWVAGTHSWLEPTALALLALGRAGLAAHPRVVEGYRLINDRAIDSGGWNYGNKAAFGHPLRPQPAPTGLALLALARQGERTPIVVRALRYLQATLPGIRASASLGWGLLGLRAWSRVPPETESWLAEAHQRATGRSDAASKLSLLLIAGGTHALRYFE